MSHRELNPKPVVDFPHTAFSLLLTKAYSYDAVSFCLNGYTMAIYPRVGPQEGTCLETNLLVVFN